MPKNIIICCDGTNNKFGDRNSNVVKLYKVLENQPDQQITFYDPGVGTLSDTGLLSPITKWLSATLGSAFGRGMQKNVEEAYSFLMEKYEAGDKIYLFGFSRGAFTVRVLAGFLHMMGLLEKGNQNLIPYAYEIYSDRKIPFGKKYKIARDFRYSYGRKIKNLDPNVKYSDGQMKNHIRKVKIHFMGLWDTVSSVGWIGNLHTYPYTDDIKDVAFIRHALAIDERRTYFTHQEFSEKLQQKKKEKKIDIKEVWFAGGHSDVGGSYPPLESGLAKIPLEWMINEAAAAGVQFNEWRYNYVLHDPKTAKGLAQDSIPDCEAKLHESLTGFWKLAEFIPRTIVLEYKPKKITKTFIPLGRRRVIPENAIIHQSVLDRQKCKDYNPSNLPKSYRIEEYKKLEFKPETEAPNSQKAK